MRQIFVDSSALYALADRRDPNHGAASAFHEETALPWVTTSLVLVETMSLLTKRAGKPTALRVGEWMLGKESLQMLHVDEPLQREAWALFSGQADKDYDLVDCASFTVMRRHGITEAFAFDGHFRQAGFRMLPERS